MFYIITPYDIIESNSLKCSTMAGLMPAESFTRIVIITFFDSKIKCINLVRLH